jgi:hypothetical protein
MNQYIKEGFIYALEKKGLSKVASEMVHNLRNEKTAEDKNVLEYEGDLRFPGAIAGALKGSPLLALLGYGIGSQVPISLKVKDTVMSPMKLIGSLIRNKGMDKESSGLIRALTKLASAISSMRRIGESALAFTKRMKGLAKTTAREVSQLRHAKVPSLPARGLRRAGKSIPKTVAEVSEKGKKAIDVYKMMNR